ncbi:hypothetical protein BT96DRAFT_90142 [Gymnopus androsaceus JB14]|uniref:Uncharacterized protein n=1 Tax=Gymnopus androsaceus JB14 TaxID=1447944 RepID=A0A6A4HHD3_9AGAR|nr:hypothetical protein BT96DRAFT_90142 [Gymnopus androsaceus JB14]
MSPEEQELIFSFAQVAFFNTVNLIVTITGYGAFALGTGITVHSLASKSFGRSQTLLLICLTTIFVCFTWDVFYSGGFNLMDVKYTFMRTLEGGIAAQGEASDEKTSTWQYMPGWAATINLILSDGIVVWRAWILFQNDKICKSVLTVLMFANIGINIADCIWDNVEITIEVSSSTILDWLSALISLVVNIVATLLIAYKAWSHHRIMSDALPIHGGRTRVENILLLLVESGAVYCGIQSVYVVFILLDTYTAVDLGFSQAMNVITAMSIVASACYPIAVIILVQTGSSPIVETYYHQAKPSSGTYQLSTILRSSSGETLFV